MIDSLARRGFLRGLASLPLIGGSIAILGAAFLKGGNHRDDEDRGRT